MNDELMSRIRRLYESLGATVETDMNQLRGHVVRTQNAFLITQDFRGNLTPAQMENALHSLIALIAGLEYHLQRWAHHNGHSPEQVSHTFRSSHSLQITHDLWNVEKHGYPLHSGKERSGKSPQLTNVRRILELRTNGNAGSSVAMTGGRNGEPLIHGDGSGVGIITGEVVTKHRDCIGQAHDILRQAINECETLMKSFGLPIRN